MNDPRDLEGQDERLSALYRETRAPEPPAWLDRRILSVARAAVESHPAPDLGWPKRRGARFWAVPVALAATVIMAVGIVRLARETGEPGTPPEMKAIQSPGKPAVSQDAAPASATTPVTADRALSRAESPSAPPPLPAERERGERLEAAPVRSKEDKASRDQRVDRPPEEWLAEIAQLRRQGQTAEAEASLKEFRRRYPAYPLVDQ